MRGHISIWIDYIDAHFPLAHTHTEARVTSQWGHKHTNISRTALRLTSWVFSPFNLSKTILISYPPVTQLWSYCLCSGHSILVYFSETSHVTVISLGVLYRAHSGLHRDSGGWWNIFEVRLWHTGTANNFTINQTVRLIWTQLLYLQFFCQSSPLKRTLE